jgi:Leucine-rich repeat (LRR) protein
MQEAIKRINIWIAQNDNNAILDLSNLGLTKLPPIPHNCIRLHCHHNELTSLPDLPSCIQLGCDNNKLTSLSDLPSCIVLWCQNNRLTHLPQLYKCEFLNCDNNNLTFLPKLPKCRTICCYNNSKYLYTENNIKYIWQSYIYSFSDDEPPKRNIINYNKHARTIQRAYKKYRIGKYKPLLTTHLLKDPISIVCSYM